MLVVTQLDPSEQGYYYALRSLTDVPRVLDFGFSASLIVLCGQTLGRSEEEGRRQRALLWRVAIWWGGLRALLLPVVSGIIGVFVFSVEQSYEWISPLIALMPGIAALVLLEPILALIQGYGKTERFWLYRFFQQNANTVLLWIPLLAGIGLFAPAVGALGSAGVAWLFVGAVWTKQRSRVGRARAGEWRETVWPLQWRLGLSTAAYSSLLVSLAPLALWTSGAVEAGRVGLTIALLSLAIGLGTAWIATEQPHWARILASGALEEARVRALGISIVALGVATSLVGAIVILRLVLDSVGPRFADRLLAPSQIAVLGFGTLGSLASHFIGEFARAHGKEVLLVSNWLGVLVVWIGAFMLSTRYGISGLVAAVFMGGLLQAVAAARAYRRLTQTMARSAPRSRR